MRQSLFGLVVVSAAMLVSVSGSPLQAEPVYAYCGYGRSGDGGCTFSTLDQCRAFIFGTGGRCDRNPRYAQGAIVDRPVRSDR